MAARLPHYNPPTARPEVTSVHNPYNDPVQMARKNSPGWKNPDLSRGTWNFPIKLMVATLVIPSFFTAGHLYFARGDFDALRDCERRIGGASSASCARLHGSYAEIVADCEAWPPVFVDQLAGIVKPLCALAIPDERTI